MAVTGWPTDAGAGQVATEDRWVQMARLWAAEGVVAGVTGGLAPSFAAGQVTIQPGAAWINGHYATNDAPVVVPTAANGLVVLRYTVAGNVFAIAFNSGATVPTQTAAIWEIPLAQVTGGVMTDVRQFTAMGGIAGKSNTDDRTFTNTGFLDLDALTGGAGTMGAVAVTVSTRTSAWVTITGTVNNAGGNTIIGFRVSGATTIASVDSALRGTDAQFVTITAQSVVPLTAGVNTFEMQARITAGTGRLVRPSLTVVTI